VALLVTWRLLRWRQGVDKRHFRTNNKEFLCNMMLRYWLASLRQSMPHTWHNILMAEEISQCPLASSSWDIVDDRARVSIPCRMFHHEAQTGDIFARHNETVQNYQIQ
jgi:hypothetical protein